jgi:demethylmenaquinone methyltransferase/2-methoxy-6-polyprenyl-1,4-benzoquinol methylase
MFDRVARRYDLANTLLSLGQDRRWRHATTAAIAPIPGDRVLDVAAGTGTATAGLRDVGVDVVGVDISAGMLAEGRRRGMARDVIVGDATALPFADGTFDAVTISFGLRNVADVPGALAEMRRVTRPGGRLVVCEFSQPAWAPWRVVYGTYLARALPLIARAVSPDPAAYVYLAQSIRAWPDAQALAGVIRENGWRRVGYRHLAGGIVALHRAWR